MASLKKQMIGMATKARFASRALAVLSSHKKDKALFAMSKALLKNRREIAAANRRDLALAKSRGLSLTVIDRLLLSDRRIASMAASLRRLALLKDPVGDVIKSWKRPNGLLIKKVRTPIGVIAIIYESRPNVTCDCAGLCLKPGDAVILRGGKEAINSNRAIFNTLKNAAKKSGVPDNAINLLTMTDRKAVGILLGLNEYIDLVIPRGGEGLITEVSRVSKIPVIKHYKGVCHTYVDKDANFRLAESVAFNAKVQRPGVCNAMETLLVHKKIAKRFLPQMISRLKNAGVEIRGCAKTRAIVSGIRPAGSRDWSTEYLELVLSVKVVDSIEEAIAHINRFGSMHSDAIITMNKKTAEKFLDMVDSSCVYVNASTRFSDGGQFGFGAEIGISTEKLHARGPMALEELTTYKYKVYGNGQIRKD